MRAARGGVIANLSSLGAWNRAPGVGLYCASKYCVTGLSESMNVELKEFGIKVCVVEPGYFRSDFLTPANSLVGGNVIEDYEGSAARKGVACLAAVNGKQAGDIVKGSTVMIDALTEAGGKEVPLRLYLGRDAYASLKAKCEETLAVLEEWKDVCTATDHDDVARTAESSNKP
jgi:short chain dehydrogenase